MDQEGKKRVLDTLKSLKEAILLDLLDFEAFRYVQPSIIDGAGPYYGKQHLLDLVDQAIRILSLRDMEGLEDEVILLLEDIKGLLKKTGDRGEAYLKRLTAAMDNTPFIQPGRPYLLNKIARLEHEYNALELQTKMLKREIARLKNRKLWERIWNK